MALTVTCHIITMVNGLNGVWTAVVYDGDRIYPFVGVECTDSVEQLELLAMTRIMQEDPVATITFHSKNKTLVGSYYAMLPMWMKANWMKAGSPIPNSELWQRIVELREGREIELQFTEEEHRFFEKGVELASTALREIEQPKNRSMPQKEGVGRIEQSNHLPIVNICTYSVCIGNESPGAWASVLIASNGTDMPLSGGELLTNPQQIALVSLIKGLEALKKKCRVRVLTDNLFVLNCFKRNWRSGWEGRDWRDSQGNPVPNKELWQRVFQLVDQHEVFFAPVERYDVKQYWGKCVSLAQAELSNAA